MLYLGGTRAPLMLDCEMWDSWPKTKAEWQKPDSCRYRYTKKFTSSVEKDILRRAPINLHRRVTRKYARDLLTTAQKLSRFVKTAI